MAALAERNLLEAVPAPVEVHKLEEAAVEKVVRAVADKLDNKAVASSSTAVVEADTADVFPEVRTICNNRNPIPSTSPRRLASKSIGNIRNTIARRPLRSGRLRHRARTRRMPR